MTPGTWSCVRTMAGTTYGIWSCAGQPGLFLMCRGGRGDSVQAAPKEPWVQGGLGREDSLRSLGLVNGLAPWGDQSSGPDCSLRGSHVGKVLHCSGPVPMVFGSETLSDCQGTARVDGSFGSEPSTAETQGLAVPPDGCCPAGPECGRQ